MIDIHTHILPGIDDGAEDYDDSVNIIRELESQGVTDIIATPHYISETIYTSPRRQNQTLLKKLQQKLKTAGVKVKLHLGNEIYISNDIPELLERGEISPLANSKYLLVELPMDGEFPNSEDIFADLIQSGFKVILAHPERYTSIRKDFEFVERLSKMGVLMQCNIGSIIGQYGKNVQKLTKKIIKADLVFAFASDTHHCRNEELITLAKEKLSKFYDEARLKELLVKNPAKILGKSV